MKPYVFTFSIMLLNELAAILMINRGEHLLAILNMTVVLVLIPVLRRELDRD